MNIPFRRHCFVNLLPFVQATSLCQGSFWGLCFRKVRPIVQGLLVVKPSGALHYLPPVKPSSESCPLPQRGSPKAC